MGLRVAVVSLLVFLAVAPGARADTMGPDYIASDNVEFVRAIKAPSGLTAGARVVGHYLYVTSAKDLQIYDISTPDDPQQVGDIHVNVQFENEEVPTNGRILGISSQYVYSGAECATTLPPPLPVEQGCLRLYDVRDPAHVKEVKAVPGAGDHTSACILDCQYMYGSAGSIVDLRTALDPGGQAKKIGNWQDAVKAQGV